MKKHLYLSLLAVLALASCTNEDLFIEKKVQNEADITVGKFTVSANDYESEDSQTRSAISRDLKFSWKSGDAIGVYPEGGEQIQFPINGGDGGNTATFDVKGWKLDSNTKYAAYYPYNSDNSKKKLSGTSIPVSYRGQNQIANGTTTHLGKYDYMVATSMSPNGNSINFDFEHVGSILYFEFPMEKYTWYTKLSLLAPEPAFANSATLNVHTGELTAKTLSTTISIDLTDVHAGDIINGPLKVWMMIPATDLSGKSLKVCLRTDEHSNVKDKTVTVQGANFERGKAYSLSIGSGSFSEVTYAELFDGPTFNDKIIHLAGPGSFFEMDDFYVYGDDKITKIIFECNSYSTEGTLVGYDIYANYDNGTVTISTSADKIILTDGEKLFDSCVRLKTIENLGCLDTSDATNMSGMFNRCKSLTSLNLSSFDTGNVTDMGEMFYWCGSLTGLDLSSFNTSNVTNMGRMFQYCFNLIGLDLSNFDTSNVTNMKSMFVGCSSLTSLDLNSFDTSNVTNMCEMFFRCESLTSLDLSSFNTGNVTNMYWMFYNCSSLTSLDLSSFDTGNVTDMGEMFYYCSSLTSLDLSNFDTSNVTNMSRMLSTLGDASTYCVVYVPSPIIYILANPSITGVNLDNVSFVSV